MDHSSESPPILDRAAIALSALCLVHCLLLPVVIALLPFAGRFNDDHLHTEMLLFVVPVSLLALGFGFRRHRRSRVVLAGLIGLAILVVGATLVHANFGATADQLVTVSGSILLAFVHYKNVRLAKRATRTLA